MTIGGNGNAKQSSSGDEATATEGDIFRDYPVRYLGKFTNNTIKNTWA